MLSKLRQRCNERCWSSSWKYKQKFIHGHIFNFTMELEESFLNSDSYTFMLAILVR